MVSFFFTFAAGVLCILCWFAAVLRLRRLMATGDIAVADLQDITPVRYVSPMMLTSTGASALAPVADRVFMLVVAC